MKSKDFSRNTYQSFILRENIIQIIHFQCLDLLLYSYSIFRSNFKDVKILFKFFAGFDKYKGGLDTVHDLTGLYSVYTSWRSIEIMFHVSTQLPYERHDPQKLQRKRHIGNDIVCVVFLEADNTGFSPACIKSHFLHTFILGE